MNRYRFNLTFGKRLADDGQWVHYDEIEPYLSYTNGRIADLERQNQTLRKIITHLQETYESPAQTAQKSKAKNLGEFCVLTSQETHQFTPYQSMSLSISNLPNPT